jgi:inosine-uridine nucleoside N-ribohydrolase
MKQDSRRLVIFDTDPGIDDAMALLFLNTLPQVKLAAITTVFGNGEVDLTTLNALFLTRRFKIDVPVYRGAEKPLKVGRRPAPAFVHGHDGLGDVGVTKGFSAAPAEGEAYRKIIEIVRANPGAVTILAVAPLTNLALALEHDPGIAPLVQEVIIMGGAFGYAGRRGNVTPVAEANIHNDPHAADRIFSAPWKLTAVGLDVTSTCILPTTVAAELARSAGDAGKFLWDISRGYDELYRRTQQVEGSCMHDVAAAALLHDKTLFKTQTGPVRVLTDGIAMGQTIQKADHQTFGPSAWDTGPSQTVCTSLDNERMVRLYVDALRTYRA